MAEPMARIPHFIDKAQWILDNAHEYFVVARHFAEQSAHFQITGKRKAMHRKGDHYYSD